MITHLDPVLFFILCNANDVNPKNIIIILIFLFGEGPYYTIYVFVLFFVHSFGLQAVPGVQITSGLMPTMSVNISFAIHARGAVLMPKGPDQSPNSVELVLTNNLDDEYIFSFEIPFDILFTDTM